MFMEKYGKLTLNSHQISTIAVSQEWRTVNMTDQIPFWSFWRPENWVLIDIVLIFKIKFPELYKKMKKYGGKTSV